MIDKAFDNKIQIEIENDTFIGGKAFSPDHHFSLPLPSPHFRWYTPRSPPSNIKTLFPIPLLHVMCNAAPVIRWSMTNYSTWHKYICVCFQNCVPRPIHSELYLYIRTRNELLQTHWYLVLHLFSSNFSSVFDLQIWMGSSVEVDQVSLNWVCKRMNHLLHRIYLTLSVPDCRLLGVVLGGFNVPRKIYQPFMELND